MKANEIKNIEDLRDYLINALDRLENKTIDPLEAGIISKKGDTILNSLKVQLTYAGMRGESPKIEFLQNCDYKEEFLEEPTKKLTGKGFLSE